MQSDIPLPGMLPGPSLDAVPNVRIVRKPVPTSLESASASGPTWQMDGDSLLLRIPGVARFLLIGGREIRVEAEDDTPPAEIAIFLIGTVLGILLHQRGQIVLHASAVRVGGRAVLFCGPSGAGKSTLAAALGQQGFPLVSDDLCALTMNGGTVSVAPDGRQLKLWAHAIGKLELEESRGAAVRKTMEKFYVEPAETVCDPLPLGAVYMLREARPPHAPGIQRPNIVDTALLLRHNAYRPILIRRMGQRDSYFHAATAIANVAGVFHLTRALDFAQMRAVTGWLRDHWAELDLRESRAA